MAGEPSQTPAANPPAGDQPPANSSTPPAGGDNPPANSIDVTKLSDAELNKVLEHPNFFNIPRVKELREKAAKADKLAEQQQQANEEQLKKDKKFEELATQKEEENKTLKEQLKNSTINSALTNVLVKDSVVDLDAALKLIDRSKLSVDENGTVTGVQEAIDALKSEKSYLFNGSGQPNVGNPSNPTNQGESGPKKFKRSQLTQEFINANKAEVYAAVNAGMIEDDGPPPNSI